MKKLYIIIIAVFVLTSCGSKKSTKVVIGLDDTFAPMGFKDNGKIVGFDIDLANAVSKEIGVEFDFKSVDWNSVILELDSKKIDLIWNGMTITEERQKKMTISKPYFQDTQALYVLENSPIKSIKDLNSKKVGLQLGSSAEEAFAKNAISSSTELTKYQDNTQALLDLKVGRLDAVVVDSVVGDYYISKSKGYVKLEENFGSEDFGVGARIGEEDLISKIDSTIEKLKANGEYDKIYRKWFGNANG